MFNLYSKTITVVAVVFAIGLIFVSVKRNRIEEKYKKSLSDIAALNSYLLTQNEAIKLWQAEGKELERELRVKEEEHAKQSVAMKKKLQKILEAEVSGGCDDAIKWGIKEGKKI